MNLAERIMLTGVFVKFLEEKDLLLKYIHTVYAYAPQLYLQDGSEYLPDEEERKDVIKMVHIIVNNLLDREGKRNRFEDLISSTISWNDTIQGSYYWHGIHDDWIARLKTAKGLM